jgi:hypothetical protein
MAAGKAIFTGTAGVYYVMYRLARMGVHAAATHGNAPGVDIMAASPDGFKTIAIQVKTTVFATRQRGRGENKAPWQLQFPLGHHSADLNREQLVFVFVDLHPFDLTRPLGAYAEPCCYVIPSKVIHEKFKGWMNLRPLIRLHEQISWMNEYKDDWEFFAKSLCLVNTPPSLISQTISQESEVSKV